MAMVFGSNTLATNWEPIRRAIEALLMTYLERDDLVNKHKKYLDMVKWDKWPNKDIVKAYACNINSDVLDLQGKKLAHPSHIYVDDTISCNKGKNEGAVSSNNQSNFHSYG